jgi:YidC/Oxa1 family membrane protein insertase
MAEFLYTIIIYPIAQIIEFVFVFAQKVFKETGLSVIAISAAISILCLPLYAVAEKWQQIERDTQKRLKPKIDKIKAVFKGDEQYMILSAYYRQNRYHPVYAMRSTFGLLIQIPFFIAAYSYLSHLEALKGASFFFIHDLGSPDALIPIRGINILPIAMTVINIAAGAVYLRGFPGKDKVQLYGMAMVFLALLYNSPAGLVLYWTMNNIFSLLKNLYYKIDWSAKKLVLKGCISGLCVFVIYYLLGIRRVKSDIRTMLAIIFAITAIMPWFVSLVKIPLIQLFRFKAGKKDTARQYVCCCFMLWIVTGLFLPSMLIGASPQEFTYIDSYTAPFFFIQNTALQAFGFFVFWPLCLFFLFPSEKQRWFSCTGLIVCVTVLCNVFFFPGNYGTISITMVFDSGIHHTSKEILLNLAALIILAVCGGLFGTRNLQKYTVALILLCCFSLLGVSGHNIIRIDREFQKVRAFHVTAASDDDTLEPVFQLSKTGKNTVILMLDRATSPFIPFIFDENLELREIYTGFVYYPNTVSFGGLTLVGAPPLFGGYEYTPEAINKRDTVTLVTKHNESLLLMPRIFSENGYEVTVTDPPFPNYSSREDLRIYNPYPDIKAVLTEGRYTKLWLQEHNLKIPLTSDILRRDLFWYSLMKIMPLAFRAGIYHDGWCRLVDSQTLLSTLDSYSVLDYLSRLTGLNAEKDTFLAMVNMTTHSSLFFQAPDYVPEVTVTNYGTGPFRKEDTYHTNVAAIKRLADWFVYLKSENVYDNTRIILVADHGVKKNFVFKMPLGFSVNVDNYNPLLMVKDFGAVGEMQTDMTFMSNADVPCLAFQGQIAEPVNPFTGTKITSNAQMSSLYIAVSAANLNPGKPLDTQFALNPKKDYYVHDNIFDANNWEKVNK